MEIRGHCLSVHADAEQGIPSAATEGESPQAGEELNKHRDGMTKAMNRDSRKKRQRGRQREEKS